MNAGRQRPSPTRTESQMNAQSPAKPPVFTLWLLRLFAVVLGLFGFLLLLGGGWLAYYGGSFYYATAAR
jgi:uncharacterized membrane protein YjjP (DUF1212 family)